MTTKLADLDLTTNLSPDNDLEQNLRQLVRSFRELERHDLALVIDFDCDESGIANVVAHVVPAGPTEAI